MILLSDINLPRRNGFEVLRDIRSLGTEEGAGTPIVAITATSIPDPNDMIAAGFAEKTRKTLNLSLKTDLGADNHGWSKRVYTSGVKSERR
jgi:CheY-like chemotaxis protein